MNMQTLAIIAVTIVGTYLIITYKSNKPPPTPPNGSICVITFLNTKNSLLNHVNNFYTFLNNFAIHYGTKKQNISGADPLLTQLLVNISYLKSIKSVEKSQVVNMYTKINTNLQSVFDVIHNGLSPNISIMANGNFKSISNQYQQYVNALTPYVNIILSGNALECTREQFILW